MLGRVAGHRRAHPATAYIRQVSSDTRNCPPYCLTKECSRAFGLLQHARSRVRVNGSQVLPSKGSGRCNVLEALTYVAGLTCASWACKAAASSTLAVLNKAGSGTGIITLSRLKHTRSNTSHRMHSVSRAAVPYRTRVRCFQGYAAGLDSNRSLMLCTFTSIGLAMPAPGPAAAAGRAGRALC